MVVIAWSNQCLEHTETSQDLGSNNKMMKSIQHIRNKNLSASGQFKSARSAHNTGESHIGQAVLTVLVHSDVLEDGGGDSLGTFLLVTPAHPTHSSPKLIMS